MADRHFVAIEFDPAQLAQHRLAEQIGLKPLRHNYLNIGERPPGDLKVIDHIAGTQALARCGLQYWLERARINRKPSMKL